MANRLSGSISPYLRQHADNPVDWWEWGDEAFGEARRRDVPVLVSIGYAACHWCHVMAHESFEDDAIAAVMNSGFVSIKVDREERPDVDAAYMNATTMLTGQGGWPMTVFVTPEGKPFYAGTYFPRLPAHQLPSFGQLLGAITEAWRERRDQIDTAATDITAAVSARIDAAPTSGSAPTLGDLDAVVEKLRAQEDRRNGGFGGAPKFPPSMVCEFLLRHAATAGDRAGAAREMAERALAAMARSGMYDQVGGGFARYAVDAGWVVPHFEKMLYDNAQLARVYAHWYRLTGTATGRRIAEETCDWMLAELGTPQGGLASSLDADTAGEEGLTYVWTPEQLRDVLGDSDGQWVAGVCGVTPAGTFESGTSTLRLLDESDPARWARLRAELKRSRDSRPQPGRDDKVVAAWNGLAMAALADAGVLFDRPDLLEAATRCADLLISLHLDDTGVWRRVSRDGTVGAAAATLEDLGCLAEGFFALHGATGEAAWLEIGGLIVETIISDFNYPAESFALRDTQEQRADARVDALGSRASVTDNASPSGASAAAGAMLVWSSLTSDAHVRGLVVSLLQGADPVLREAPRFAGWWLAVASALADGPAEIELAGRPLAGAREMGLAATSVPWPGAVVTWDRDHHRPPLGGRTTAYLCDYGACAPPTVESDWRGWSRPTGPGG